MHKQIILFSTTMKEITFAEHLCSITVKYVAD